MENQPAKVEVSKIPQEIKDISQWICWESISRDNNKIDKIPINPTDGKNASTNNSATWTSFNKAVEYYQNNEGKISGIGFVFSVQDPFLGLDFDDIIDPENPKLELNLQTEAYLDRFHSYSEITPSGRGIHILIKAKTPGFRHRKGNIEIYDQKRFFTVTGNHIPTTPPRIEHRQEEINTLYCDLFGIEEDQRSKSTSSSTLSDSEILDLATKAQNNEKFSKLMQGNYSAYPSESEADLALCGILVFYTQNPEQLDRLFRQSKLCDKKWDEKRGVTTYGQITIEKAIQGTIETYSVLPSTSEVQRTDVGNAELFAVQHGDTIRYNLDTGQWLFYDKLRWNPHTGKESAHRLAINTARSILGKANNVNDNQERKAIAKWSFASEAATKLRAMLDLTKYLKPIACHAEEFDQDQFLLNVENGVIDLRTGQLRAHDPTDMITKLAPVTWKGEISNPNDNNQLWLPCLDTWMNKDGQQISYLKRLGGMCLTGSTSSRIFPIFHGPGKNGKNSFLDTLMKMMGDYATVAPGNLLKSSNYEEHSTELAGLVGSRLVIASETKRNMVLKTSLVKSFTGDARMKARFMRQDFFEFEPTFKVILMTQNMPDIDEITDAIWDRVHKVGWNVRISKQNQDHQLLNKLEAEWPHILGWFIQGCREWLQDKYLESTEKIRKDTSAYRDEMNPLKEFIEECCVVGKDKFIRGIILKEEFDQWSRTEKKQLSSKEFSSYMRESGYIYDLKKIETKPVKGWFGLCMQRDAME